MIFFIITSIAACWYLLEKTQQSIVQATTLEQAKNYRYTIERLRAYYTAEVVNRIHITEIDVSHDYKSKENTIPLPATLTMELGKSIGESVEGLEVKLVSQYPFPWRKNRMLTDFEMQALQELVNGDSQQYYEIKKTGKASYLYYASPDILQPQCVYCHNNHPDTPKSDWGLGDVRGILTITLPLNLQQNELDDFFKYLLWVILFLGLLLTATVYWLVKQISFHTYKVN